MGDLGTQPTMTIGPISTGAVFADRYEIRDLVGEGGMGAVYRALDRELDEEIALKVLRPELAATPEALVRFRREVKLARRVTHPNIARTYDLGEHGGVRFLTMELVTGHSLRESTKLALPEIMRIASEISHGLAAAHSAGVVHRDLKPDNILIAGERVVLTDFGIARSADPSDMLRTSGGIVGTPAYIAPEQLEGSNVDGRADVYALGVMLYELLSGGELPFEGESATAIAVARLVRPANPLRAEVPEGVRSLVMEMLARRKDDRPDAHTTIARLAKLRGSAVDSRIRVATQELPMPSLAQQTIRLGVFEGPGAPDFGAAIGDALTKERTIRFLRGDGSGDLRLECSVRSAGERVRVRLRLLDARGESVWAEHVEGTSADPFALEDAVTDLALAGIRARSGRATGPDEPLRERYDRARARLIETNLAATRECIAMLEALDAEHPNDPWVMSLHALAMVTLGTQTGGDDASIFSRAEELALRSLDRDPTIGQTYQVIAGLRALAGDYRSALAAARESIRRNPLEAGSHALVGEILCDAGRTAEGLQRLDLATRLDPQSPTPAREKSLTLALLGDRAGAEREVKRIEATNPTAAVIARLRLFAWFEDRALATSTAELITKHATGSAWEAAGPLMAAYGEGALESRLDDLRQRAPMMTSDRVAPRFRALMYEIIAEFMLLGGDEKAALDAIEEAAHLSVFIDLVWLDRCPLLARVRDEARFAEARAIVAERVAQIMGD